MVDKKIYWGTVVYPGSWEFFYEYLESFVSQTDKSAELLVVNDGIASKVLEETIENHGISYEIIDSESGNDAVKNRIQLIKEAKRKKATLLIIGDSDDLFSNNRVELVNDAFSRCPNASFFYNEIVNMDGSPAMLPLPTTTNKIEDICEYNYLGMSNTAINMQLLSDEFIDSLNECKSQIFDWYLHTRLILSYGKGQLVENACTYYRLHGDNVAGVRECSADNIKYELDVKKKHYGMLRHYDSLFEELFELYQSLEISTVDLNVDKRLHYWWDLIKIK